MGIFKKYFTRDKKQELNQGVEKTKKSLFGQIAKAVAGKSTVDESFLDELEGILISSDVGLDTTVKIIERLEKKVSEDKYFNTSELNSILKSVIVDILGENNTEDIEDFVFPEFHKPYVLLVVGVNGVGKTTTIGKLAHQYKKRGKKIVLGAADTFRAVSYTHLTLPTIYSV